MGKMGNSWALVKQSFQVLRADKELMLLPVFSAISCVLVTVTIAAGGFVALTPYIRANMAANPNWQPGPALTIGGLFVFYLVNFFLIVFFNTALVGAAGIRLSGGDPTLKDGLRIAWERKGVILQWAVLAATVGIILRLLEERAGWVGKIVIRFIGVAWALASYFVVPVLAFENLGPFDALKRSAHIFRERWGEKVVGGFSFGLIFVLLGLAGLALPIAGAVVADGTGLMIGGVLMVIYWVLLAVVSAATQGIFVTALYRYATKDEVAPGFQLENFSMAWQPKRA